MNPPIRILVADDTAAKRLAIVRMLSQAGYEVLQAAGGIEALHLARTAAPDLVLLDVEMPDLDGKEVCRQLKTDPALNAIPVLHFSATSTTSQHRTEGLDSGADGYVVWPLAPAELLAWVRALLRIRQSELALRAANAELTLKLAEVKTLQGLIPICASCKKIRDDRGFWSQIETYVSKHSGATFSHGICPDCARKFYAEIEGAHVGIGAEPALTREPTAASQPPRPRGTPAPAADRTMLLVEPDPAVRESIRRVLTDAGFTVATAASGTGATQALVANPDGFALALIQQTMTVMSGIVTLHALARIQPSLPALLLTDGTDPGIPSELQPNVRACLARPFTNDQLLAAVREACSVAR